MPVFARLDGTAIRFFYNDHPPPHVHAEHGGERAILSIDDGTLLAGGLPPSILRRVTEWMDLNKAALGLAWQRARAGEPVGEI